MTAAQPITIRGVSKSYGAARVLRNVDLVLEPGEVHALVGANGSGKSTLIKILAGAEAPEPGATLHVGGASHDLTGWNGNRSRAAGLRFVHQDPCLFWNLSVTENLSADGPIARTRLGRIPWRRLHKSSAKLLSRFGLDIDPRATLENLGPADRAMVAIARALRDVETGGAGVLVLDEPTASLPRPEVQILLAAIRRLAATGHSVLYVSHRLDEILTVTDRVSVLRDGKRIATRPTADLDEQALIELITGKRVNQVSRNVTPSRHTRPVLRVGGLSSARLRDISIEVRPGEVLGIAGLLGSGRSELLRVLFGDRPRTGGTVEIDGIAVEPRSPHDAMRQGIVHVPEDRGKDAAFPEMSVDDNLAAAFLDRYWSGGRLRHSDRRRDSQRLIAQFSVKAHSVQQPMRTLSGGNQQKVILARCLRRRPRLILLDEPTQGVDIGARADIYRLVREATDDGAAAIVVASDLQELAQVCDRVLIMRDGCLVNECVPPHLDAATLNDSLYRSKEQSTR